MRTVLARVAVWAGMTLSLSGCAVLLVGAGAAGGYAVSKDSVKNNFDLPAGEVFRASRDVVRAAGLMTTEDESHGMLKAVVEGADVTVTVKSISKRTVELKVKARDNLLIPKIDIAQGLYTKILERLPH